MQAGLRTSTERQAQGHEIQAARMDAMGYRMAEMKDMVAEREVRMEAQMQEVCSQIQAMGAMLKNIQPRPAPASNTIKELLQDTDVSLPKPMKSVSLKPKESVTTATNPSGSKQHLERYAPLPQPLHYSAQASFLLLFVESGTRKFRCLSVECLFVESGTNDVNCQFCTVRGMVVESEILKALCCALSNKACLCTLMWSQMERPHQPRRNLSRLRYQQNIFHPRPKLTRKNQRAR